MKSERKNDPYWILSQIETMRKAGVPEKDVAMRLGFVNTMQMRRWKSGFFAGERVVYQRWAEYLKKEGKSVGEIALIIGKPESSVRLLMDEDVQRKVEEA